MSTLVELFPIARICVTHLLLASACCPWGPPVAGSQSPYCHWLYLHIILLVSGNETIFCVHSLFYLSPIRAFPHTPSPPPKSEWMSQYNIHRSSYDNKTHTDPYYHPSAKSSVDAPAGCSAEEDFSPKGISKHIVCVGKRAEKRLTQCQIANDNFPALPTDYEEKKNGIHIRVALLLLLLCVWNILREGDSGHCLSDSGFE